ncbi:L-aspartate oxidase [Baia soyae]|uniref:L-aspartate oxidase n=1 Tax=Baia soyae TaxID=1544746 RepID=A0A4R2RNY8_9BACL|nr:L-aspartate oxidase [Baia soyae]TCP61531.1 L-aspartate oxidase [Baia soyae]
MSMVQTDYIVIGSGIAGLTTALSLGRTGHVMILTKAKQEESNSWRAQGGIAAAVGEDDSPILHQEDTLRTGVGLCNVESVNMLVQMGPNTIDKLSEWGTRFDRSDDGWSLGREGSHSVSRILHVTGDSTGAGITSSLLEKVHEQSNIQLHPHTVVQELIVRNGICHGVIMMDAERKQQVLTARKGVILATGGCGQVFRYTTNDLVTTGDGFALAHRAGAKLVDMEFIQFHPTALAVEQNPMFLISEAVRGEGAFLVNDLGEKFMKRYHDWEDLAPRDVVSRSIYTEMQQGRSIYLDATGIGDSFPERFPKIFRHCMKHGIDPRTDLIPVTPATHFIMGGIQTDLDGRTNIERLFACGEVACTGVHGANRLASNSLLEGAVFAQRVADSVSALPDLLMQEINFPEYVHDYTDPEQAKIWKNEIREIMWDHCGIVRNRERLETGLVHIRQLRDKIERGFFECRNMLITAQIILESALAREESRGGHYREDFPETKDKWAEKHHVI